MKIAILSRGPTLYSTQSLVKAAKKRGHLVNIIDFLKCRISIERSKQRIYYESRPLKNVDAVIPRIGTSVTQQGVIIVRQFELMKKITTARSDAILKTRNKINSLQILSSRGIPIPKTVFSYHGFDSGRMLETFCGKPVVIKLLQGTHGMGVMLAEEPAIAYSIMESFANSRERFMVQEYIKESAGSDIRALVVGNKVVAAMKRKAMPGDFRANLHQGGRGIHIKLTAQEENIALRSARFMGLDVAGVDMLQSNRGPLLLEVNASPGLEGIETVTNKDVAGAIIELIEQKSKKHE